MEPRIRYDTRQELDLEKLGALFEAAWGSPKPGYGRVFAHRFTWVSASSGDELVGFVNVAWDGDVHLMTDFYKRCGFEATSAGLLNLTR